MIFIKPIAAPNKVIRPMIVAAREISRVFSASY
jgi:hypothetical protein